jgi:hypothetical protein
MSWKVVALALVTLRGEDRGVGPLGARGSREQHDDGVGGAAAPGAAEIQQRGRTGSVASSGSHDNAEALRQAASLGMTLACHPRSQQALPSFVSCTR